ncbi:MAG: GTPase HflX [bacterium]|nr:GTPase HflX [bacterium]
MPEPKGNIIGLKPNQKKSLAKLYQRKIPKECIITPELARSLSEISVDTGRQIGILADRRGSVIDVIVGDSKSIMISELKRFRAGRSRFRGVRLLHTHLGSEPLTKDDLTDLALLRFDAVVAIEALEIGLPGKVHCAWLIPNGEKGRPWHIEPPVSVHDLNINFAELIGDLEHEFAELAIDADEVGETRRKAILVGVTTNKMEDLRQSVAELKELALSAGVKIVETVVQKRPSLNPRYVVGTGKLQDLMITALQTGADLIIFEGELTGSQMRAISEYCDIEVIDRTQLILDIFAKRATSRDGKLQVELAQMKYSLPRLVLKDDFLSRITGGIGAKGPGETKIEVLRRRVKDRIAQLEHELDKLSAQRRLRRAKRAESDLPIVNIVGYTNAGKSTILRTLTGADVLVEDKMFATLDPTSRRLRLPSGREVILIDTVGFIQDLPESLAKAFRATLEEIGDADYLVHAVDISQPGYGDRILAVQDILEELALDSIPSLLVFNKTDKASEETLAEASQSWPEAVMASALTADGLKPFLEALDAMIKETKPQ